MYDVFMLRVELESAEGELTAWISKVDSADTGAFPGAWGAVGLAGLPALHGFYILTLRRSCAALESCVSESMREAYSRVRAKLSSELGQIAQDEGRHLFAGTARRSGLAVLRSHALRVQSCLLSAAAAQLEPQPAQGPHGRPTRRPRRMMQAAADALTEARALLSMLQQQAEEESLASQGSSAPAHPLADEFGNELIASGILDHWSRLLLLLAACEGWQNEAARELYAMADILSGLDRCAEVDISSCSVLGATWRWELLACSPCLCFLLASHIVGLCSALDGGATYGMPGKAGDDEGEQDGGAATVAPLFTTTGLCLPRRGAPEGADTVLALWTLGLWRTSALVMTEAQALAGRGCRLLAAMPPLREGAVFDLSMRLALAAADIMAAAAAATSIDLDAVSAGRLVSAASAAQIASEALRCGLCSLRFLSPGAAVGAAMAAGMRRWWCALVAVVDAAEAGAGRRADSPLRVAWLHGIHLTMAIQQGEEGTLPPRPSPWLSAALESGFLSRVPGMLKALKGVEGGDTMQYVGLPGRNAGTEWAWAQILAFGSPRDTAPLVDLVAARLQAAVDALPRGAAAPLERRTAAAHIVEEALQDCRMIFRIAVRGFPSAAEGCAVASAAAASGDDSDGDSGTAAAARPAERPVSAAAAVSQAAVPIAAAGPERLGQMLSYMCMELLPPLSVGLMRCYLENLHGQLKREKQIASLLEDSLEWLVLLAAALKRTSDGAATAAVDAGDQDAAGGQDGMCSDAAAAAEWRRLFLLLVEMLLSVYSLAVGSLRTADCKDECEGLQHALQRTASYLAALAPKELAGLLLSCDLAGPLGSPSPPSTATTGVQGEGNVVQQLLGLRQAVEDDAAAAGGDKMELMAQRLLEVPWLAPPPADVEAWVAAAALLPPPSRSRVLMLGVA
ncbi:hypothetical protein GPECTOR_50g594 [Gonium pectorale]|uniref:Uncharacterized protein n=1 Tax=Gonium pectorale TaxID=33097 RepID=A0A150G8W3_GONPE|nr:hypothetical protein GPECTOR_50g594 [Gonium pectorale]|eukprot:KXZ45800.1 hypothetical protein GPECTOR_50g594 [Gonium pectorale]